MGRVDSFETSPQLQPYVQKLKYRRTRDGHQVIKILVQEVHIKGELIKLFTQNASQRT